MKKSKGMRIMELVIRYGSARSMETFYTDGVRNTKKAKRELAKGERAFGKLLELVYGGDK